MLSAIICLILFKAVFFLPTTFLAADHKLHSLNCILLMTKNDSKKVEIYNLLATYTISSDYDH